LFFLLEPIVIHACNKKPVRNCCSEAFELMTTCCCL